MPAVWGNRGNKWELLRPVGFSDERTLHDLVESTPELLPLSGSPSLTVLGREVRLAEGYADLLAVEPSGRLVVIEVKLSTNAEARRAIVAQVMAYAAVLHGLSVEELEADVLAASLRRGGHSSVADVVAEEDQTGDFDPDQFSDALAESLASGRFRLVFVLDDAPAELVRTVGFLEQIGDHLVVDLVAVSSFELDGPRILVPQRVDAERPAPAPTPRRQSARTKGTLTDGADAFLEDIANTAEHRQEGLRRLVDWAIGLEREGLVHLYSYRGNKGLSTLLPRFVDEKAGLATIYRDVKTDYVELHRSVFERRAPSQIERVEQLLAPAPFTPRPDIKDPPDGLLDALTDAYRQAAGAR